MWGWIFRLLVGLFLLPVGWIASQTLFSLLLSIQPDETMLPEPFLALSGGFIVWQLVYFLLPRPIRTYVLAHELTHALWGTLMGARVSKLRVSKDGGSVTLSKTNFLITLAPYFFPLYTVLIVIAFYMLSLYYPMEPYYYLWLGLVGFTWGFHLNFTITTLLQKQSDIQAYGYLFSYALIYTMNVLGICLWIVMVSSATLDQFGSDFAKHTVETARKIQLESTQLSAKLAQ